MCDKAGNSKAFIEFMLDALLTSLQETEIAESTKSAPSRHAPEVPGDTFIGELMMIAERNDRTMFSNQIVHPLQSEFI